MPSSLSAEAPITFVCDCEEWMRSACERLLFFKEHEGKRYCVLHYPDGGKSAAFREALKEKLDVRDFDFRGVWFPDDVDFSGRTFTFPANFTGARFGALADFSSATFEAEAIFTSVIFCAEANFRNVVFAAKASFDSARFCSQANFFYVTFSAEANFFYTKFSALADFGSATFKDYVRFAGDGRNREFGHNSSLNLQFARIEKPERFSFHTVRLYPYYFVNVDPRKFEFTSVDWQWYAPNFWDALQVRGKLKRQLREKLIPSYRVLAVACRRLAVNAEENNFYRNASSFRYLAMNVERLDTGYGFGLWTVDWWYWLASGFGERIPRALITFFVIWLSFAFLFWLPNPVRCPEDSSAAYCLRWEKKEGKTGDYFEGFANSAAYAIEAMTLQKPEPKPASPAAHLAVLLCAILGPVQAALLALAIRRKVMR